MHPDLYHDIHVTLEGLQKYMDDIPLESQEDVELYSLAFQAAMYLKWLLDASEEVRRNASQG